MKMKIEFESDDSEELMRMLDEFLFSSRCDEYTFSIPEESDVSVQKTANNSKNGNEPLTKSKRKVRE